MTAWPWWAYGIGLTASAIMLFHVLPALVWWGEEVSVWLWLLHSTWGTCDPRRQPLGGFRCACGRTGDSFDDFPGQGEGYVGLHRRVFTRDGRSQERIRWDAPPTREEEERRCRDEQG